jgi:diaminopimelate decarboxylase
LARRFGTPLYVYDESTVRARCREYRESIGNAGEVLYSAKAFASPGFLRVVAAEGLGIDVVSAGELGLARAAGYQGESIHFLGNNKSLEDIAAAWEVRATLVVDGFHDFELVRRVLPAGAGMRCLVRISPGVRPDTQDQIATGQLDSKFGFPIASGAAREAVERALTEDRLQLVGIHCHIGSQIFDLAAYQRAMAVMLDFAALLRRDIGLVVERLGAGGGLGIAYTCQDRPPSPGQFVGVLLEALERGCRERGLRVPALVVEPGRSIAGPAGVALYTVGSIKEIPGVRRYVAVDGGMGDNIRPKLYGARYEAILASAPVAAPTETVTVVGKYCESTDVLIADVPLPQLRPGDVLCLPAAGAYCLSMASNYNGMPRPAAVMVREGRARLLRRRETLEDLLAIEVLDVSTRQPSRVSEQE